MSSSRNALRFLAGWLIGAAAGLFFLVLLTWAVDPSGVLAGRGGGGLCAPGGKLAPGFAQRMLLLDALQPREAILGSSRSMWMFAGAESPRRANLAFSSASFDEIDRLARHAVASGKTRTLLIGVDDGAFLLDLPQTEPLSTDVAVPLVREWLSLHAAGDAIESVVTGACTDPATTALGFPRRPPPGARRDRAVLGDVQRRRHLLQGTIANPAQAAQLARIRTARLATLLGYARGRDVEIVLFLTPSHPRYHALLGELGLTPVRAAWRKQIVDLADRFGATLVPADTSAFVERAVAGRCPPARPVDDCAFYDVTHARPAVGREILTSASHRVSLE